MAMAEVWGGQAALRRRLSCLLLGWKPNPEPIMMPFIPGHWCSGTVGGRHADPKKFYRCCRLRDLWSRRIHCSRGLGTDHAPRNYSWRHAKDLSQTDGPTSGYVTLLVEAEIEAGVAVGRHTHPGVESAYVLEGGFELPIEGQPTRTLKPGDGFQIPPATPHAGGKPGSAKSRILITYVVEKGKPLASPA